MLGEVMGHHGITRSFRGAGYYETEHHRRISQELDAAIRHGGLIALCGIVGSGAGELIAEAVLAIEMGCEVHDITDSVHPHPTLSETLMNAGEIHFGTATEIYKPKRKPAKA